ncbi:Signal recognition particle subunit SRP68 [Nakaseomyces bracarensis]|uniref:Signal recognition particle subunit SRP68 n=1 Tax=Nakaseomyces bracarensis TaxID=273131 RepID=A0ABR4NRE4_9SACH
MGIYSPIGATYGTRVDQILETDQDFAKYHEKLNRKLQKLRHRCQGVTKDTKRYSEKEKLTKVTHEHYDNKSKLYGVLFLLHAERDLALVETLKMRGRQRGKLKRAEKKVINTRLKKVAQTVQKLVELTKNEQNPFTRLQYLVYERLALAEYTLFGKVTKKNKTTNRVTSLLATPFAALKFLNDKGLVNEDILGLIHSKYEYTLKQYSGNLVSNQELNNFIAKIIHEIGEKDELVKILLDNGYTIEVKEVNESAVNSLTNISWRSFNAKITDHEVSSSIEAAQSVEIKNVTDYSTQLLHWDNALNRQETIIKNFDENEIDNDDEIDNPQENNQILLAYINYNRLLVNTLRDNEIFKQLYGQWNTTCPTISAKIVKFKELDRITKNLKVFLQEIMELPGIYSDDELMYQLELLTLYYQTIISSGTLAYLYQAKGYYREALALHIAAFKKLDSKLEDSMSSISEVILPKSLFDITEIVKTKENVKSAWTGVVALAGYQKTVKNTKNKYEYSVIEKLNYGVSLNPTEISLRNLFPMSPKIHPVSAKPTLFDLAFNYVQYEKGNVSSNVDTQQESKQNISAVIEKEEPKKKRGFLGLFGRS